MKKLSVSVVRDGSLNSLENLGPGGSRRCFQSLSGSVYFLLFIVNFFNQIYQYHFDAGSANVSGLQINIHEIRLLVIIVVVPVVLS